MKNIKIKLLVHSLIDDLENGRIVEGLPEVNDSEHDAEMKISDNAVCISYKEVGEGGTVYYDVLSKSDRVTVSRTGAINSCMVFSEGETRKSMYEIPPYKFDMEVVGKRVRSELSECGGRIDLRYSMKVGGAEKSAGMRIWILTD